MVRLALPGTRMLRGCAAASSGTSAIGSGARAPRHCRFVGSASRGPLRIEPLQKRTAENAERAGNSVLCVLCTLRGSMSIYCRPRDAISRSPSHAQIPTLHS